VEELESVGVSAEWHGEFEILLGHQQEELGHPQEALAKYRAAASSSDAPAAAQGRLREIALRLALHELPQKDAIPALETLTVIWRGDDTEAEGLQLLARLYRAEGRYSDAFRAMRNALVAAPESDITRKIQDEAAASFQELFLSSKGDTLAPVEALGLFYDNRNLIPIGRSGDEMIRRLADRLVAVDLLDQAAELLQHQVDKRLQGAARAQVAAKLATIYLMNHKAERALATLRATRDSDVSNELRQHRLLLEARALSELGRHPLALEIVSELESPEAHRLRADVLWSAKRWRGAAEEIERLYGDRWRDFKALNDIERSDVMRAAIGYALADESIALARLRQKYAAKMAEGPDARAFDIVTSPIGTSGPEFQDVARRIGTVDTLAAFLNEIRARYEKPERQQATADAKPEYKPEPKAEAAADRKSPPPPKGGRPLKPDPMPTGSVHVRGGD
jgi:Tfp pilus assembly protein PilF